jgi:hypothetical protein
MPHDRDLNRLRNVSGDKIDVVEDARSGGGKVDVCVLLLGCATSGLSHQVGSGHNDLEEGPALAWLVVEHRLLLHHGDVQAESLLAAFLVSFRQATLQCIIPHPLNQTPSHSECRV